MDKSKKLYKEIEQCMSQVPREPITLQNLRLGGFVHKNRAVADSLIIELGQWTSDKDTLCAILDHHKPIFENWRKEHSWSEIKDLLLYANSEIGSKGHKPLAEIPAKWLVQWFDEIEQPAKQDEGAGDEVQAATGNVIDFSHMKSFSPVKDLEFDMSAVYKLLIDESVFEDIDYQLFSNSISHAYINELWGNDTQGRNRNLLQCLFKQLAPRYPKQWIKECATNLGLTVKQISNPTTSGKTKDFENKLWHILRAKAPK